jgi:hypothetical protein
MDASNYGYDEVTHINWIMMQAMLDGVIKASNGMMRFEGPGLYAKDVDLDGPAIRTIVGAMASNIPTTIRRWSRRKFLRAGEW